MKNCCVCNAEKSSYKCPTCKITYCSVPCYKIHTSTPCSPSKSAEAPPENSVKPQKYDFPTEDTVPHKKLQLLRDNKEVKECLKNPHVRDIARAILNDADPTKAIGLAMTEPIFVELANACLKIVESQEIPQDSC